MLIMKDEGLRLSTVMNDVMGALGRVQHEELEKLKETFKKIHQSETAKTNCDRIESSDERQRCHIATSERIFRKEVKEYERYLGLLSPFLSRGYKAMSDEAAYLDRCLSELQGERSDIATYTLYDLQQQLIVQMRVYAALSEARCTPPDFIHQPYRAE